MIKETVTQVRPNTSVAWPEDTLVMATQAEQDSVMNYLQTQYYDPGKVTKVITTTPDGLTRTIEFVFQDLAVVHNFYHDTQLQAFKQARNTYLENNNILTSYTQEGFDRFSV